MRKFKKFLVGLLGVLLVLGIGFGVYVSQYYHADQTAIKEVIARESIAETDQSEHWISLKSESSDVGFIFYPGAKVEYTAYLPLMEKMQEEGYNSFLIHMPFNLAIFDSDAADDVIKENPEIKTWYIGGHSMGGAFASSYAAKHQDKIKGLVLLGAYLYGDYPVEKTLTIYGSEDKVLNRDKITYTENVFVIEGGNHAEFGNYGEQKGDGKATITPEEQQEKTIKFIQESDLLAN